MAVTLSRKAPVQLIAKTAAPTEREKAALSVVGLAVPTTPVGKVFIKKKYPDIQVGDKIKVTNDLWNWIKWRKPGDTGTVLRRIHSERMMDGLPNDLYEIKVDVVRVPGYDWILLRRWEIDLV